jgi:nucleoside-diphosphate-sugar epimerase
MSTVQDPRKKIVVFGGKIVALCILRCQGLVLGSGFVGQGVVREALVQGHDVIAVNRNGAPSEFEAPSQPNVGKVDWVKGDIMKPEEWKETIKGADGAVSCVGVIMKANEVSFAIFIGASFSLFLIFFLFLGNGENQW